METNEMTNEELVVAEDNEDELEEVCSGNDYNVAVGLALGAIIGVIGTLIVPKVKNKIAAAKARRASRKSGVVDAEFEEVEEETESKEEPEK